MSLEHLRQIYPVIQLTAGDFEVNAVRTGGDGKPIILLPGAQGTSEIFQATTCLGARGTCFRLRIRL